MIDPNPPFVRFHTDENVLVISVNIVLSSEIFMPPRAS